LIAEWGLENKNAENRRQKSEVTGCAAVLLTPVFCMLSAVFSFRIPQLKIPQLINPFRSAAVAGVLIFWPL
jgi:hypothetical protein